MKQKLYSILTLAVLVLASSCDNIADYDKDYTDLHDILNTAPPQITGIYDVSDTELAVPLSEGRAGMMIRIVGKDLNQVRSVRFLTADPELSAEADLTQAYTYYTSANVLVPEDIGQKVRQIEYTTDQGSVRYPFIIPFPQLQVITSQYILQGTSLTLYGKYFDKYKTLQAMDGDTRLELQSVTDATVTVRLQATDTPGVTLTWTDGDGQAQSRYIAIHPVQNLLYGDFSGTQFAKDGIQYTIEDDATLPQAAALGNPHLHITAALDAWAWKTLDLSQNMPYAIGSPQDYILVFEILTPTDTPLIPSESGNELILLQFNWDEMLRWSPGQGAGLNTNSQWMTVSMPLDGQNISAKDTWQTLRMILHPNTAWNADFRLANIRILHK